MVSPEGVVLRDEPVSRDGDERDMVTVVVSALVEDNAAVTSQR